MKNSKSNLRVEYVQDCSRDSELLRYYANREYDWQRTGTVLKRAIAALNFTAYFSFDMSSLNSLYFTVQRMRYQKELYVIVTNSCINYFFKIV